MKACAVKRTQGTGAQQRDKISTIAFLLLCLSLPFRGIALVFGKKGQGADQKVSYPVFFSVLRGSVHIRRHL